MKHNEKISCIILVICLKENLRQFQNVMMIIPKICDWLRLRGTYKSPIPEHWLMYGRQGIWIIFLEKVLRDKYVE